MEQHLCQRSFRDPSRVTIPAFFCLIATQVLLKATKVLSFPRKRESRVKGLLLDPRFRGDDDNWGGDNIKTKIYTTGKSG